MARVHDQIERALAAMDDDDPRRPALKRFVSRTEDPYGWLLQHANGEYPDEGVDLNEPDIEDLVRAWSA